MNPRESVLYSFDVPASLGEISPDGKTLAFGKSIHQEDWNDYSQVWLLELSSREVTKLVERGYVSGRSVWSEDGSKLIYRTFENEGLERVNEIRIIDVDGKNDTLLFEDTDDDVLNYYWSDDGTISLVRLGSIDKVTVDGREAVAKRAASSIKPVPSGNNPEVEAASNDTLLLVDYDPGFLAERLKIVLPDGQERTIDTEHAARNDFALSPNGSLMAYVAGPREPSISGNSFWISDLRGERQRKTLDLTGNIATRGAILDPVWSPDGKTIIIILTEYGTSPNYRLAQVDVESGKVSELGVDDVDSEPIFSPDGKYIYYTRTTDQVDDPPLGKTTFYQLQVQ